MLNRFCRTDLEMSLVCKWTRLPSEILDSDQKAGGRKPGEDVEEEYVAK